MYIKYLVKDEINDKVKSYYGNKIYDLGLNTEEDFDPTVVCGKGLYFCKYPSPNKWFSAYGTEVVHWVSIPDGVREIREGNKYKAPAIVLERELTTTEREIMRVKQILLPIFNPYRLSHYQPLSQCLWAVQSDGLQLQYVRNKTPEICLKAVQQNGWAFEWVPFQTPELGEELIKHYGRVLKFAGTLEKLTRAYELQKLDRVLNEYRKKPYRH